MRSTFFLLALGLFGSSMACAGNGAAATGGGGYGESAMARGGGAAGGRGDGGDGVRSPGGRHVVAVNHGGVYVDGRRVHAAGHDVEVLAAPIWRADGNAVAWTERGDGETRLVVVSQVGRGGTEPMVWPLPRIADQDRVHWSGFTKVVVGPSLLQPRAVANWSELQVR